MFLPLSWLKTKRKNKKHFQFMTTIETIANNIRDTTINRVFFFFFFFFLGGGGGGGVGGALVPLALACPPLDRLRILFYM